MIFHIHWVDKYIVKVSFICFLSLFTMTVRKLEITFVACLVNTSVKQGCTGQ